MINKKNVPIETEDNKAFFMSAYKNDPIARKDMDADMKKKGLTYEQYFGIEMDPAMKYAPKKK